MKIFQILLDSAEPRDVGREGCLFQSTGWGTNRISISIVVHNMPKQGKSAQLDYSNEFGLLCLPQYIIVPDKLVPFDAKQHMQTPLVKCSASILRASVFDIAQQSEILVRCTCCTASTSLRYRAVTSKSDFLSSAWQHE